MNELLLFSNIFNNQIVKYKNASIPALSSLLAGINEGRVMGNPQIEIQLEKNFLEGNYYWKKLISLFARVGLKFEIHCWNEEVEEIKAALKFGKEKSEDWEYGTIIEGIIDENFIEMIYHTAKPMNIDIFIKRTPFFSIFFENGFSSEHYGTEIHILSVPIDDMNFIELLKEMREYVVINEYL